MKSECERGRKREAVIRRRMAETNLAFSKIVSTPTASAWSQAYSAGRLFAAFSLESDTPRPDDGLSNLGKDLISTFESEFFTLENKDLESIKAAVATTVSRVGEGIKVSLVVCFFSEDVLYLFAAGGAKAILKRDEKIGTVLEGNEGVNIKSASGYVEEADIIVLQTNQFLNTISASTLASALDSNVPEDIAESLAPQVHERTEGGASAVVLVYNKEKVREDEAAAAAAEIVSNNSEETEKETPQDSGEEPTQTEADRVHDEEIGEAKTLPPHETKTVTDIKVAAGEAQIDAAGKSRRRFSQGMSLSFLGRFRGLTRQRKIILFIAVILIVLIIVISAFALGRRGATSSDFDAIYNEALTKYEEGQSLRQLNPSLSQDSFRQAQQILLANKDTFDEGSSEDQQIEELLAKVTSGITGDGGQVSVSEVGADQSKMLSLAIDNPKASYFSQNEDFVYFIKSDGITKVDKGNSEEEELIEKSWKQEGGLGLFGSNVYVLDRQNGILKFVPTDDGFSETDYFTGDSPDFSEAAAIAIDGSIYVLHTNGTINKYTRGEEESFEITGLTTNFSSPTRILTSEDFDNIYILDRGNSRIVVLDKAGAFVNSYTAAVIKSAREFDVDEVGGKIYVLSGEKVYQIEI